MSDTAWIAVCGVATTLVVNIAAVVIAYMKLRTPVHEIRRTTNGMLTEATRRADAAQSTLADAAAIALSQTTPVTHDEPPAP